MPKAVCLNTITRVIPGESLENRNHVIQLLIQYLSYKWLDSLVRAKAFTYSNLAMKNERIRVRLVLQNTGSHEPQE